MMTRRAARRKMTGGKRIERQSEISARAAGRRNDLLLGLAEGAPIFSKKISPAMTVADAQNNIFKLYAAPDPAAPYFEALRGGAFDGCFEDVKEEDIPEEVEYISEEAAAEETEVSAEPEAEAAEEPEIEAPAEPEKIPDRKPRVTKDRDLVQLFGNTVLPEEGEKKSLKRSERLEIAGSVRPGDNTRFIPGAGVERGSAIGGILRSAFKDIGYDIKIGKTVSNPGHLTFAVTGSGLRRLSEREDERNSLTAKIGHGAELAFFTGEPDLAVVRLKNEAKRSACSYDLLTSPQFTDQDWNIPVPFGWRVPGDARVIGLSKLRHMLVAGNPGSGKTSFIRQMILGMISGADPRDVRMLILDPKGDIPDEYGTIPHMAAPVVRTESACMEAIRIAAEETERRRSLFEKNGCRSVSEYNRRVIRKNSVPWLVIFADNYDLISKHGGAAFTNTVMKILTRGFDAGMTLVLSTSVISAQMIPGIFKANIPTRVCFKVSSEINARQVMDSTGPERLPERGDMFLMAEGFTRKEYIECPLATDSDVLKAGRHAGELLERPGFDVRFSDISGNGGE